jgi:regulator of sigma E protease
LAPGDLITGMNGRPVADFREIGELVRMRTGDPISLTVQRGSGLQSLTVVPVRHDFTDPLTGRVSRLGYLGLTPSMTPGDVYRKHYNPIEALANGVSTTWGILSTTVDYLGRIVTGRESPSQLGSLVGMAQTSGAVAKAAVQSTPNLGGQIVNLSLSLLGLAAFLSVSIGFMNLLPIPVLDGGHLVFYAYEAVTRRPAAAKVQAVGYRVGLALLLGLMLFATWNDFHQIPVLKILGGLFS